MINIRDYLGNKDGEEYIARKEYSPYALQQTRNILNNGINDEAKCRKYVEGVTIDGPESKDLDDAIWAEKGVNGYKVHIHIADPTEAIKKYSPLDIEALKRTTSIYREEGVLNMYPPELANGLFSLNEDGKKLTLTIEIDLDFDGEVQNFQVFESIFKNKKRHDYNSFIDDFINPDSQYHKTFQTMYEIANIRNQKRKKKGAKLNIDETDRRLFLGKKEPKIIKNIEKIPHKIVEEWAILGNFCAARYIIKNELINIFRVHLEYNEEAFYSGKNLGHKGLALEYYSHFTSPIRRFPDNIIHRVIKDNINDRNSCYENTEVEQISKYVNKKTVSIKIAGELYEKEGIMEEKNEDITNEDLIKNKISLGKEIPSNIAKEIKNEIQFGNIDDWIWSIGFFLISKEKEIKELIYNKLIEERKMEFQKIISILNNTKIIRGDKSGIFQIEEEINEIYKLIAINFKFKGKKVIRLEKNYENEHDIRFIIYEQREEIIKKIFGMFMEQ